ncbi:MAG: RNA 2'-phosphotransferase [Anaerolineae bacterium]|nr:RNA 2'-phosphotransferase [Anaerolineae bacterium]MCX8066763.1 RNA 2'-phosphotransferase [Anaerolineae bacterium]MDW7990824.1 RNA 2'-phosphotransferase [Anaerolineae bacterium]
MNPEQARRVKLSKFLALILRHQPERFGLHLDEEGWASLPEVLEILQGLPNFRWATRADVLEIVERGSGDEKRRFEIAGDRIRARYGHTVPLAPRYPPCQPPPILYHGTSSHALNHIRREGLRPMRRQYVHLSADPETAVRVGARHTPKPVVLTVRAAEAATAGVLFYRADEGTYLSGPIPPQFLEFPEESEK